MVLLESADRAIDHDTTPLRDFEFIKSYLISAGYTSFLDCMQKIPFIGNYFKQLLFAHFSLGYDVIVNYIEGHELAAYLISEMLTQNEYVETI